MKHTIPYLLLATVTLYFAWGYYSMRQLLIDRVELEEVAVTVTKKVYPLPPYRLEYDLIEVEYMRREDI